MQLAAQHHNRLSLMIKPAAPAPKLGRGLQSQHAVAVIIWTPPVSHKPADPKGDAARAAYFNRVRAQAVASKTLPAAFADVARDFRAGQQDTDGERAARNAALAVQLDALALKRRMVSSLLVTALFGVILATAAIIYLLAK